MLTAVLSGCAGGEVFDEDSQENVAVDLSFSVSSDAHRPSTRLTPAVIQDDGQAFRGIEDLRVIPFGVKGAITQSDQPLPFQQSDVSEDNYDRQKESNAWFYCFERCYFPRGTASFLVYGRAVPSLDPANSTDVTANKAYNGSVISDIPADGLPSAISFRLESIRSDNSVPVQAAQLADFLTGIANTAGEGVGDNAERVWATTSEPSLKSLYFSFINRTDEGFQPMAGSSANVAAHVAALKKYLAGITVSNANHQRLLDALKEKVDAGLPASLQGYPASVGLPDGAAVLRWNGTAFVVETETTTLARVNNISRYAYPPEICYYGNSQIYTSDNAVNKVDYESATAWSSVLNHYENQSGATISGNTQAVALIDPLQYAVARLRLNIKNTTSTLPDANGAAVTVSSNSFPMTGILVGGQLPLGFDFKPKTPYSELEARFAYDRHVADASSHTICLTAGSGVSESTSTLVLQTFDGKDVPVVLEFTNNSGDFMGQDGLVYKGTKFYLVGVINPDEASGETEETKGRVFTQDYTTSVTVKIESLAKAYNVLPDLLSPRLEVGIEMMKQWVQAKPTNIQLD